jgi:hypothetical protein
MKREDHGGDSMECMASTSINVVASDIVCG